MVASVSPSATTYVSPPAAGDGLGEGLGDGDGGGGTAGFASGDGLGVAGAATVAVGDGGLPPTQPQAITRTVPTMSAWTGHRGFTRVGFQNIVWQQYGLQRLHGPQLDKTDAES